MKLFRRLHKSPQIFRALLTIVSSSILTFLLASCGALSAKIQTRGRDNKIEPASAAKEGSQNASGGACPVQSASPEGSVADKTTTTNSTGDTTTPTSAGTTANGQTLAPDFLRVIKAKCVACHSGLYPPNLAADADVLTNSAAIQAAVANLSMPPPPGSMNAQEREFIAAGPYASPTSIGQTPTPTAEPLPPTQEFLALVTSRCTPCHNASTKPTLVTQTEILNLKIAIQGAVSLGSMPPPPSKLSPEDIKIILRGTTEDALAKVPNNIGGTDPKGKFVTAVAGKCSFCHNGSVPPRLLSEADILRKVTESQQEVFKNEMPRRPTTLSPDQERAILDYNPAAQVALPLLALSIQAPAYESDVKPLVAAKCLSCHKAGATPPNLSDFENLRTSYDASLVAIKAGRMPIGSMLGTPDIQLLEDWKSGGFTLSNGSAPTNPSGAPNPNCP